MAGLTARLPGWVLTVRVWLAPEPLDCQGAVTPEPAVRATERSLDEGNSLAICCTTAKVTLYVGCVSECENVFVCPKLYSICVCSHMLHSCVWVNWMLIHQCVFVLAVYLNVSTLTPGEPCVSMRLLSCYLSGAKVVDEHEVAFRHQSHCWELSGRPKIITFCWHFK